jgi:hypothetical protein
MRVWSAHGAKVPQEGAEDHAGEGKERGDEGASPAPAEVGEFGNRLGKQDLVSVALKVAQDRSAEDGGNNDDAEQRRTDVVEGVGVGRIQKNLAIAVADGARSSPTRRRGKKT